MLLFGLVVSVEKRIIREQSCNTKEEKLRTRIHRFLRGKSLRGKKLTVAAKTVFTNTQDSVTSGLHWRLCIYIYINKLINPKPKSRPSVKECQYNLTSQK
jgi:hypothetical protein